MQLRFVGQVCSMVVFAAALIAEAHARSLTELRTASFGEIGFLQPVRCPIGGRYDCLTFPHNLYELNGACFTLGFGATLLGYEEAMLLQFRSGGLAIMVKTGIGDRFEIIEIERAYDCPDAF